MSKYSNLFRDVISYIEANLDQPIDVARLCQHFNLSKYHFHRQCSAYFGMPLMSVVRLLRLKRAAYQLAFGANEKIMDIALECGYDSHEAFTRSFSAILSKVLQSLGNVLIGQLGTANMKLF